MNKIVIPVSIINEMIHHAKEAYPKEACGILTGIDMKAKKLYRMKNIDNSEVSYEMDSREQFQVMKEIEKEGLKMLAIYHSHPASPPYPSQRDIGLAFYPDTVYIIIGLTTETPEINAFLMREGEVDKIEIQSTP
ncbi:MAG: M67 family metallopeptidase [Nitrospirae bacterium]|nr:M67 family metallopeptidase [Nitrospirota bacterium]